MQSFLRSKMLTSLKHLTLGTTLSDENTWEADGLQHLIESEHLNPAIKAKLRKELACRRTQPIHAEDTSWWDEDEAVR